MLEERIIAESLIDWICIGKSLLARFLEAAETQLDLFLYRHTDRTPNKSGPEDRMRDPQTVSADGQSVCRVRVTGSLRLRKSMLCDSRISACGERSSQLTGLRKRRQEVNHRATAIYASF